MPTSKSLKGVDAELAERVQLLLSLIPSAWVASAFRTYAQQKALYDGWKAGIPGYAPANYPGTSMHEKGLAVDVDCDAADAPLRARLAKQCGLYTPHSNEPWHMELDPKRTPLDSAVVPSITVSNHGEIDMAALKTHYFQNVQLDTSGNGWVPVDATPEQIIDITQQGSFPPADKYWNICQYAKQARTLTGSQSVIEITGGTRKQIVSFWVQVAA